MSLEDSIKATAKGAEGRLQAAAGDLKDKAQQAAAAVGDALHGLTGKGD